jgi:hypothetical protein
VIRHMGIVLFALVLFALAGCGSSGGSPTESAISTMKDAISTYNSAHPTNVASTGRACSSAAATVGGLSLPPTASVPSKQRALLRALHNAYTGMRHGFSDCATAGNHDSYTRMAQATQELGDANRWLDRARTLRG